MVDSRTKKPPSAPVMWGITLSLSLVVSLSFSGKMILNAKAYLLGEYPIVEEVEPQPQHLLVVQEQFPENSVVFLGMEGGNELYLVEQGESGLLVDVAPDGTLTLLDELRAE